MHEVTKSKSRRAVNTATMLDTIFHTVKTITTVARPGNETADTEQVTAVRKRRRMLMKVPLRTLAPLKRVQIRERQMVTEENNEHGDKAIK